MRVRIIRERGFVLIAMSVSMFLLLAVIGLAFDLGRVYIARNEAQVFTDAAAMTAAARLDGTPAGLTTAREDVAHLPIRWNLGTEDFRGVVIEFSADQVHWEKDPKDAADNLEITFLRAVGGPQSLKVPASAVATVNPVRLVE